MAVVLEGFGEDLAPDAERRQGLYVRWPPQTGDLARVKTFYVVLLGGILLVTLVAWRLLSLLVVTPLASLASAADRMAGGDGEARVPTTGTGDEFDRTAQAFNRMAREVSEYQGQLEERVLQALSRIQKAEQHLAIAQRLAATGKLASGIAHEINNPLGGMRNAVRALARGDLDPKKTAEYLALVQDGLARVEDTVKKVLTFTPRAVKPQPTDLADVVKKATALARHRTDKKEVVLEERLPAAGEVTVFGDPHELQQVALNLLLNAADAVPGSSRRGRKSGEGKVEVEVKTEGDQAVLRVTDDGVGMTPEVQAQCFDLFFTTKEVGEGTGLGLAVVHNIVSNHGGRIELESAPGRGTTFRVFLPRETPASAGGGDGAASPPRAVTRP
jgi:signal transduction histidine kinase